MADAANDNAQKVAELVYSDKSEKCEMGKAGEILNKENAIVDDNHFNNIDHIDIYDLDDKHYKIQ